MVADIAVESSVSAYKRDTVRDAFDGVMSDLATGRIDGLVTYELDLFRPQAHGASATLGEDVHSAGQELDDERPGPSALVIDRSVLEWRLDPSCPDRVDEMASAERRVIIVCNEGYSSSLAAATLRQLGLHRATDLVGGVQSLLADLRASPADVDVNGGAAPPR